MNFKTQQLVVKISVSNMLKSKAFYEDILGFKVDDRYTINKGGQYETESYMQLTDSSAGDLPFVLGLYKDIEKPYPVMSQNGTVPSFIVDNISIVLKYFLEQGVVVVPFKEDKGHVDYIIQNKSDEGFVDYFFFFCDPDNNSLVIRQNLPGPHKHM